MSLRFSQRLYAHAAVFSMSPLPVFVLVAIAGSVDALVAVHSKELLAVYMTGNSSKLAQSLVHGAWQKCATLAAVIVCFVAATTFAAWVGAKVAHWRAAAILAMTGLVLACAAPFDSEAWAPSTTCLLACAMGAINEVRRDEPGVTFLTGNFIRVGRDLAEGKPRAAGVGLLRWLAFVAGAAAGCLLDGVASAYGIAVIAACVLGCAAVTAWFTLFERRARAGSHPGSHPDMQPDSRHSGAASSHHLKHDGGFNRVRE